VVCESPKKRKFRATIKGGRAAKGWLWIKKTGEKIAMMEKEVHLSGQITREKSRISGQGRWGGGGGGGGVGVGGVKCHPKLW